MIGKNGKWRTVAIAALASVSVATAVAAPKTKTFSTGNISQGVPHESVVAKALKVKTKGKIKDLNAVVGFDTNSNEDYTFLLRHPGGKTIHLSSGNGGSGNGYGSGGCESTVTFDDEATTPIEDTEGVDTLLFGGYQPEQRHAGFSGLEELDGKKLQGTWKLIVIDTEPLGLGTLECFKLKAKYSPAT